jgi:hypothetical protein
MEASALLMVYYLLKLYSHVVMQQRHVQIRACLLCLATCLHMHLVVARFAPGSGLSINQQHVLKLMRAGHLTSQSMLHA